MGKLQRLQAPEKGDRENNSHLGPQGILLPGVQTIHLSITVLTSLSQAGEASLAHFTEIV